MSLGTRRSVSILIAGLLAALLIVSPVPRAPLADGADGDLCALVDPQALAEALQVELSSYGSADFCSWTSSDGSVSVNAMIPSPIALDPESFTDDQRLEIAGWSGYELDYERSYQAQLEHGDQSLMVTLVGDDPAVPLKPAAMLIIEAIVAAGPEPQAPTPSPAPSAPPDAASLDDPIGRDLATGVIDEPTAALYHVYSAFGDSRLPEAYVDGGRADPTAALADALLITQEASPDIEAALAPYLVRPTDPRSVFHASPAAPIARAALVSTDSTAQRSCPADGWDRLPSQVVPVVLWATCRDDGSTQAIAGVLRYIEEAYKAEVLYMDYPVPDDGGPDHGGDTRIDFYLVDQSICQATRCLDLAHSGLTLPDYPLVGNAGSSASSGYILLDRTYVGKTGMRSIIAHELFHLLGYAHNMQATHNGKEWHWFVEASAKWAEHHFVPDERAWSPYPRFDAFQSTSLSLDSPDVGNTYSSWVWPYFMQQEKGARAVADAWDAMRDKVGWEGVDDALDAVLPTWSNFREFAVRAINKPMPGSTEPDAIRRRFRDQTVDGDFPLTPPGPSKWTDLGLLDPDPVGVPARTFAIQIPHLAARYQEFRVDDGVKSLVLDLSGLTPGGVAEVEALVHLRGSGWVRRALSDVKTTFCRNDPSDDLDQLILVFADGDHSQDVSGTYSLEPRAEPCLRVRLGLHLDGQVEMGSLEYPGDTLTTASIRIDLKLVRPNGLDEPGPMLVEGGTVEVQATWTGYCRGATSFTGTIEPAEDAHLMHIGHDTAYGDLSISTGSVGMVDGPTTHGERLELSGSINQPVTLDCEDPTQNGYQQLTIVFGVPCGDGVVLKRVGPEAYQGDCAATESWARGEWRGTATGKEEPSPGPPEEPGPAPVAHIVTN